MLPSFSLSSFFPPPFIYKRIGSDEVHVYTAEVVVKIDVLDKTKCQDTPLINYELLCCERNGQ